MSLTPEQKKASFVNRARISANAGKWLALAGIIFGGAGLSLSAVHLGVIAAMGVAAIVLQYPRQVAWRLQNDAIEFASLAAMPLVLFAVSYWWLKPSGVLSIGTVLQGLGGFFVTLGIFHIVTRTHTLQLADEIERQL